MSETYLSMHRQSDSQLDLSGLDCPLPLLKTKQCLNKLAIGALVMVTTTDQGSVRDFQSFLSISNHSLMALQQNEEKGEYYFLIQCG